MTSHNSQLTTNNVVNCETKSLVPLVQKTLMFDIVIYPSHPPSRQDTPLFFTLHSSYHPLASTSPFCSNALGLFVPTH